MLFTCLLPRFGQNYFLEWRSRKIHAKQCQNCNKNRLKYVEGIKFLSNNGKRKLFLTPVVIMSQFRLLQSCEIPQDFRFFFFFFIKSQRKTEMNRGVDIFLLADAGPSASYRCWWDETKACARCVRVAATIMEFVCEQRASWSPVRPDARLAVGN